MALFGKRMPVAIDLFAGAGGLSEGFEAAGVRVVLAQELHPQPALTHALNHPQTPVIVGDIRALDLTLLEKILRQHHAVEEVDVVMGGPPCQGFSSAGKKNANDPRNSLFRDFCLVVARFKPKVVVLENVPGFKNKYGGGAYLEARKNLEDLGYEVQDEILQACDYGVPQRRLRFIMVAVRRNLGLVYRWPEKTHERPRSFRQTSFEFSYRPFVTVLDALSDLSFVQPGFEANQHQSPAQTPYQEARRASGSQLVFNHLATKHRPKAVAMFACIPEGGTISAVPAELRSAKRTMARLDRSDISNAVLALPDDLLHYEQHRIPSVREMARLQSFDDDYVFIGKRTSGFMERKTDVPQYTQVGNSVPPLLGRAIANSILAMLGHGTVDARDRNGRLQAHKWIRGSSGFAGYVLTPGARVALYDLKGDAIPLPWSADAPLVEERPSLVAWTEGGRSGLKRQWAPGVEAPSVPTVAA